MLSKGYLAFGTLVLTFYSVAAFAGWEFFSPARQAAGAGAVARGPGGRGHYSSGYRGGK